MLPTPTPPLDDDNDNRALDLRLANLLSQRQPADVSTPLAPRAGAHFSTDLLPTHPSDDDDEDIRALERRLEALLSERQAEHVSAPPTPFPTFSPAPASQNTDTIVPHLAMDTDFSADLLPGPNHPFTLAAAQRTHDNTARDDTARAYAFAQRELDAHIAATLAEEAFYKAQQDAKTVVVSNLAADAQEEDVRGVFGVWKRGILDVTFERDEKKRTRTARVEMTTRKNAVSVVNEVFGNVFGLVFKAELAVEEEEEEKEDEGKRFGDVQLFKLE